MVILDEIGRRLRAGDHERVAELTRQAIDNGVAASEILNNGLLAGMDIVGERFRVHEIFLPDVLLAARAMYAGMDLLKPLLIADEVPTRGTVIIGTVQGDLHDIGKNLVGIMLRGAGFEVIDLGRDVPAARFIETAEKENAPVIGLSALLTTTMTSMREVIELRAERGLAESVKVIVGGAPVNADWAREIGADAYGFDAANAVDQVKGLVGAA